VGLGLANVKQRLQAHYGQSAVLDAQRGPQHFRVTLLLPAREEG
jgi:LytS/YehU family sensor histidine kinase